MSHRRPRRHAAPAKGWSGDRGWLDEKQPDSAVGTPVAPIVELGPPAWARRIRTVYYWLPWSWENYDDFIAPLLSPPVRALIGEHRGHGDTLLCQRPLDDRAHWQCPRCRVGGRLGEPVEISFGGLTKASREVISQTCRRLNR